MANFQFKLPDVGEGTVEAEIVEWHVAPGDLVDEDQTLVEVMTDKATVELPSPVAGKIVACNGEPGELLAVGAVLVEFETDTDAPAADDSPEETAPSVDVVAEESIPTLKPVEPVKPAPEPEPPRERASVSVASAAPAVPPLTTKLASGARPLASPAVRKMAREAGVDLADVVGEGPSGRIRKEDLQRHLDGGTNDVAREQAVGERRSGVQEIRIIGVRRVIAQRMAESKRSIPHFAYVEEVDVTELERLRQHLNAQYGDSRPKLTYLPFMVRALARVLPQFPQCNAVYDEERNVIVQHDAIHMGIATQTDSGLKVPVVRHAEALGLWQCAAEIKRVSEAARSGKATGADLTGSTITLTSLGPIAGIVTTPVINHPEVAIIGPNKAVERVVVENGEMVVRRMMNISSSFDHRFVDGYDAAAMIQTLKSMLENPATIFVS